MVMKPQEVLTWIKKARPGARLCYYEGFLGAERAALELVDGHFEWHRDSELDQLGALLWGAYLRGDVLLTQERTGKGAFRYWAHKRSKG